MERVPEAAFGLGIHILHGFEQAAHLLPLPFLIVRAHFQEGFVLVDFCPCAQVVLSHPTERADNLERHLAKGLPDGHGRKRAVVGQVHQGCSENVVAVVTEGDALATELLGQGEEGLSARPRTEETGSAACIAVRGHLAALEVEIGTLFVGKVFEIARIGAVINTLHTHMQGRKAEGLCGVPTIFTQQLEQCHGVLASAEAYQHVVAWCYQMIGTDAFAKLSPHAVGQLSVGGGQLGFIYTHNK